jgi:hypothetical protein
MEDKNTHGHDHDRHFCSIHIITHNVIAIYLKPGRRATPSCTTTPNRQHPEAHEARRLESHQPKYLSLATADDQQQATRTPAQTSLTPSATSANTAA